jgi:hypothetical protein
MSDYEQLAYKLRKPLAPYFASFTASNIGTWSPTYLGLATAGVTTYSNQLGSWTRIGTMIHAWGRVAWTAASGTGAALISVPVAPVFTRVTRYPVLVFPINVTFANGSVVGVLESGTGSSQFYMNSPATNAAGTVVAVEAAGDVSFAVSYEVE